MPYYGPVAPGANYAQRQQRYTQTGNPNFIGPLQSERSGQVLGANTGFQGGNGQVVQQPQGEVGSGGPNFDDARARAEEQARKALEAAIGVFNAKKQGILNRIPGLEEETNLTLRGFDEGLENFNQTANREEGKRVSDLQLQGEQIGEEYGQAARKTRASAKGLSRQLRNLFAGAGTLDSTQYRDMNIEQSNSLLQGLGDMNREKAYKTTANQKEQEDIKNYYSEQRVQEERRVKIEKEKVQSEARALKQRILDDATLTDAQKIEAVVEAQSRLDNRMADLDMKEAELKEARRREDRDYELKIAQLNNKGYSDSYTQAKNSSTALKGAAATVESYISKFGAMTPDQVAGVFTQYGFSPEESQYYGTLYGNKTVMKDKENSSGISSW